MVDLSPWDAVRPLANAGGLCAPGGSQTGPHIPDGTLSPAEQLHTANGIAFEYNNALQYRHILLENPTIQLHI